MVYTPTRLFATLGALIVACALFVLPVHAQEVTTSGTVLLTKAAPGDTVPLSIKLVNFGNDERVDVTIFYEIVNADDTAVISLSETVAVETTASFVKNIALPPTLAPGQYTAHTRIIYDGQLVPATGAYQFEVERTVFGLFLSELLLYSGIVLVVIALITTLLIVLLRKRTRDRLTPRDYSHVPREQRIFYEIIGDTILQMRYHEGNEAIALAVGIQGLVFDERAGRIISITGDPAQILAELIRRYRERFGKQINFSVAGPHKGKAMIR